jgi:hypothetical protein
VYSQPETVNLEDGENRGIPATVSVKSGGRNAPTKKYKLFLVPEKSKGYEVICISNWPRVALLFVKQSAARLVTKAQFLLCLQGNCMLPKLQAQHPSIQKYQ